MFVGPASSFLLEQIKVLSSTLATSLGRVLWYRQPGSFSWLSSCISPVEIASFLRASSCSLLPSIQTTWSGFVRATTSSTHFKTLGFLVSDIVFSSLNVIAHVCNMHINNWIMKPCSTIHFIIYYNIFSVWCQ